MIICPHCSNKFDSKALHCPECSFSPPIIDGFPAFAPDYSENNDGFSSGFHDKLFTLETNYFWFQIRNKILLYFLDLFFPNAESLCEIGCGTGYVLSGFASNRKDINYTGCEIYSNALKHAASRVPNACFIQADICHFPFEDEFDVIGAFDILEHIIDDDLALANIYNATPKGGGIIITVPQHKWLWSELDVAASHKRRYSKSELTTKVEKTGFKIEIITSFLTLLFPLMIAGRLKSRFFPKKDYDPMKGLEISSMLNSIFYKVCLLEQTLIKKGARFPFGGSLVCVARKP